MWFSEYEGITQRTALIHFNTGITELEYFGKGKSFFFKKNVIRFSLFFFSEPKTTS